MGRAILCLYVCLGLFFNAGLAYAEVNAEHAWVRMQLAVADTAAAYLTLRNTGVREVVVVRVSSDVSETSEVHMMRKQGALMRMSVIEHMTIPAHGFVTLEPGGQHIMLAGLKRELNQGQNVNLALHFMDGSVIRVVAPVRDSHSVQEPARQLFKQAVSLLGKQQIAGAVTLFQQASKQGNRRAQYQLGLLYARGVGLGKNLVKARELLHNAAMQGHPKAQFYLGQMYAFGDGGEKDSIKATMWFWLATTLGDRFARDSLRVMTGKISSLELTEAKKRAGVLWQEMPRDMKIEHGMAMH